MAKIGSARISENGTVHGNPGDQTGKEVAVEEFYFHKKTWLDFRPKSEAHAKALAQAMRDACENDFIGYDQGSTGDKDRLGVYKWVRGGTKIKAIKVPTSCDCSGLERATILEATGVNLANFNTASEPEVLKKSGLFEPPFEVASVHQIKEGDILVTKEKGHTATVVEAKEFTEEKPKAEPAKAEPTGPIKLQPSKYRDSMLRGSYKAFVATKLRYAAGEDAPIVMDVPLNAKVTCWGYHNIVNGIRWLSVVYAGKTGYISLSELKKI